jgi:hypothetical protein
MGEEGALPQACKQSGRAKPRCQENTPGYRYSHIVKADAITAHETFW